MAERERGMLTDDDGVLAHTKVVVFGVFAGLFAVYLCVLFGIGMEWWEWSRWDAAFKWGAGTFLGGGTIFGIGHRWTHKPEAGGS